MDTTQAQRVIESLRKGIPPDGFVRNFTVGRSSEIEDLAQRLESPEGMALLLNANYGSGKTHLLRFIREQALSQNYVVSTVTLDAKSEVRFNRMDQIFGAVCRNIEIPSAPGNKGIRSFFDYLSKCASDRSSGTYWRELSSNWKWDYSEKLDSTALFVGLRAWATGKPDIADIVEDWLYQPWQYRSQRKKLYAILVDGLRRHFRDPRPEWKFYADEVFMFHTQGHAQSWAALRDFDGLSRVAGFRGMIILFDEFEDVITNITNVAHQEAAFWNLFHFYSGKHFPGKTFYAVTPEFIEKCKNRLLQKGRWDFDFSRFDALPRFEMSPLELDHLIELSKRICPVHGLAYDWDAPENLNGDGIKDVLENAVRVQIQDRTRHAITSLIKRLDSALQGRL
ncbi:MAG: BREX system ATP-binding domain-containing protein [candidate division Zixibacteria bacterium]|nr:BREX system ATP-binding domain-containing protein [candidate division Zixibacteria bacterium]